MLTIIPFGILKNNKELREIFVKGEAISALK